MESLIFIQSPKGFGTWTPAAFEPRLSPVTLPLPVPGAPIVVTYDRASRAVRVADTTVTGAGSSVEVVIVDSAGVRVALRRAYPLRDRAEADLIGSVWARIVPLIDRGPPVANLTPWPAVLPCRGARAVTLKLDGAFDDDVRWFSADRAVSRSFTLAQVGKPIHGESPFPIGRLDRLSSRGFPLQLQHERLLELACGEIAAVAWGPCANGRCVAHATYPAPRVPKAWRTQLWTAPIPYPDADEYPEIHYSRFKRRLGYRKAGDPEIERQSVRLARDLAADLRDLLVVACPDARCAPPVRAAVPALTAFLGARSPRYSILEHVKAYDHWNTGWSWTVTAGGTTVEAGCADITESPEVFCSLELDVGDDLRLSFRAKNDVFVRDAEVTSPRAPTPVSRCRSERSRSRRTTGGDPRSNWGAARSRCATREAPGLRLAEGPGSLVSPRR